MEKNQSIIDKLKQINVDYESLKPFMKDYLYRIEKFIEEKNSERLAGIKMIKDSRFTISSVSKALECSRTTLYNHDELLKRYIELSIDLFELNDPYIAYNKLKASINELEAKVDKMILRDIDTELLREENNQYLMKLKESIEQINRLQSRNAELSKEIRDLRKKNTNSNKTESIIINIKDK